MKGGTDSSLYHMYPPLAGATGGRTDEGLESRFN